MSNPPLHDLNKHFYASFLAAPSAPKGKDKPKKAAEPVAPEPVADDAKPAEPTDQPAAQE